MKVILVNGSGNKNGCTFTALSEICNVLEQKGIETEIFQLGKNPVRDCIGCGACRKIGEKCVFDDDLSTNSLKKPKQQTVSYSARLFITHIRPDGCFHLWIGRFLRQRPFLSLNRQLQ